MNGSKQRNYVNTSFNHAVPPLVGVVVQGLVGLLDDFVLDWSGKLHKRRNSLKDELKLDFRILNTWNGERCKLEEGGWQ